MRPWQKFRVLALALVCALPLAAQNPGAVVSFTFDFPNSEPEHYVLSVSADGHAKYESTGKLSQDAAPTDPFVLEFTATSATSGRIFDLAKRSKYFADDLDSHKKGLASTGAKTLSYQDGAQKTQSTYNYSTKGPVQELTALFQAMSSTLEFGHRLDYYHRYQKLALDDELKVMEDMAKNGSLTELQAIAPVLRQLTADTTLINPVRARAQRLMQLGEASSPGAQ